MKLSIVFICSQCCTESGTKTWKYPLNVCNTRLPNKRKLTTWQRGKCQRLIGPKVIKMSDSLRKEHVLSRGRHPWNVAVRQVWTATGWKPVIPTCSGLKYTILYFDHSKRLSIHTFTKVPLYMWEQANMRLSCSCEGYCLMRESTSASSGPSWFSPPSSSSTNLFSSYSSTSTRLKRADTVFFDMFAAVWMFEAYPMRSRIKVQIWPFFFFFPPLILLSVEAASWLPSPFSGWFLL